MSSTISLSDISEFITKGATPTTYGYKWELSGVPFLRSECVSEDGLNMAESMFISIQADRVLRRSRVVDGDLLITITGNVGRVVRFTGFDQANINQHIARARINASAFDSRFVYHYLSQTNVREKFESITTGQAYPQLSLAQVRNVQIPVMPLSRQEVIADALDTADEHISNLKDVAAKKRDVKQGMMQELLTGRTRLDGFTGEWREATLEELGVFLKGRGIKRENVRASGVPCIRYGELYTTHRNYTRTTVSFVEPGVAERALPIRTGDILFAGSGETKAEIGMAAAYVGTSNAVAGGDIVVLRGRGFDPVFLGSLLNTPSLSAQKASLGQGDAVVHIGAPALGSLRFRLPGYEEQAAIASALQDADAEIEALERRLESARAVKVGMMQELLTGRTRLPVEEDS